jgi:outer membrane protein assembly factor BamB
MNQPETLDRPVPEPVPAGAPRLRLRFPSICLLVFWVAFFVVGAFNKPYFFGFLYGMASALVVTLLFFGWWWLNRGLRLWEKCAGFALVILEAWLVGRFSHRSVNFFTLWMSGLPVVATAIVAWLFLSKWAKISWEKTGFAIVVTLVWSYFLLIRLDGADSSLSIKTHWRWTPTTEEQFLTESRGGAMGFKLSAASKSIPAAPLGSDWVAFRGPNRDGVIIGSDITTNWSTHPPSLIWKHDVGPAWSSLLVVGNHLYTQEQRGEQEVVVCYDSTSGEQVWLHNDATRFEESVSGPGPRATPTFANGRLYTVGGTGLLNCLEAGTGQLVWKRDLKQDSGAKVPMWAFASSPLVLDDLVIVYAGGEAGKALLAYRSQSGDLVWTTPGGQSTYSSPQLTTIDGVAQCLILHDEGLMAVDVATGKRLWEAGIAMKGAPRCGQPHLVEGNKLLVGVLDGMGSSLVEISRQGDQWKAAIQWDSKDLKPEFPDFVVHNGYAYGFDIGMFCCLNLADGKRTWKEGRYGRGEVMLLRDQGLLLVSSETGELVLLAADPAAHRELARFQALRGKTWNHPVVIGDRIYLRNAQEMACYSLATAALAR